MVEAEASAGDHGAEHIGGARRSRAGDRGASGVAATIGSGMNMTTQGSGTVAEAPETGVRGRRTIDDELDGIVSTLCAKFPGHRRSSVEALVSQTYDQLKAGATVSAHLIPLTLNLSLRSIRRSGAMVLRAGVQEGLDEQAAG
jgi:hypothetical protein